MRPLDRVKSLDLQFLICRGKTPRSKVTEQQPTIKLYPSDLRWSEAKQFHTLTKLCSQI
jgi:hypothetical protein